MKLKNAVFLDPSYDLYHKNGMFDLSNKIFNRDDQLLPFVKVKEYFESKGVPTNTADCLLNNQICANKNYYYSFGSLTYKKLLHRKDIEFKAFFIMEAFILAPNLYKMLPELTKVFDEVYVHNVEGKGYSLKGVDQSKLRKIYWPIPYESVLDNLWINKIRNNKLVVINGNHNPRFRKPEFYSTRIKAMSALSKHNAVDLYGRGWKKWYSKQSLWPTYFIYLKNILKIYKGECESKYDVLSNYKFCLCFENTPMEGYITEKIFDCFYAGTIPVYLGDPKVNEYIPKECYINMREFDNYESMLDHIKNLTDEEINHMRNSAKNFMESKGKHIYTNFLINVFKQSGIVELKNN